MIRRRSFAPWLALKRETRPPGSCDNVIRVVGVNSYSLTARLLLPILTLVYWAVGFYPFHWYSPFGSHDNGVQELVRGGFFFPKRGIAYTETAPKWVIAAIKNNAFALELTVVSHDSHQAGPARIFTISRDHYNRNFTVGQSGEDLVVRVRTRATGANGAPDYVIPQVFLAGTRERIAIDVSSRKLRIRVSGHQPLLAALPDDALSNWNPGYRLALGNEFTYQRPWHGEIRTALIRVPGKKINYATTPSLRTPEMFTLDRDLLADEIAAFASLDHDSADLTDIALNFFGFMPFGFLLAYARFRARSTLVVAVWCATLSLSIEIGQLFFDLRFPKALDVFFNVLGGYVGAWGARYVPEARTR